MGGAEWERYANHADDDFEVRVPVEAGLRTVAVAFVDHPALEEGVLQPPVDMSTFGYSTDEEMGGKPAVGNVVIGGPFDGETPDDVPSRQRLFVCRPADGAAEEACAREIIATLARRAYRRPVTASDVDHLYGFFETARRQERLRRGRSDRARTGARRSGVPVPHSAPAGGRGRRGLPHRRRRAGVAALVLPVEQHPRRRAARPRRARRARAPEVLDGQVRRMLADPRSASLAGNFVDRWLELHKIRNVAPDPPSSPRSTRTCATPCSRRRRSSWRASCARTAAVVDLLRANDTFLNERLARHYGVPGVYGNHFRRVVLPDDRRAGLLGKASILTLTSYSTRTSVVNRGKWLLERVLGSPPPAPPANVPPLEESGDGAAPTSQRERMEAHRRNPTCAVCHRVMDPLGFALDNFDAIGRWRTTDDPRIPGQRGPMIDASGVMPDGTRFEGPAGLRQLLLDRQPGVHSDGDREALHVCARPAAGAPDMPVVRQIVRDAADQDYRWSALIQGIVKSAPFQLRGVG